MVTEEIKTDIKDIDEILRSVRSMNPGDIVVVDYPNFREYVPRILDHMKIGVYIECRVFEKNAHLLCMARKCRDIRFQYLNVNSSNYMDFARVLMSDKPFNVLVLGKLIPPVSNIYGLPIKDYMKAVDTARRWKPSLN